MIDKDELSNKAIKNEDDKKIRTTKKKEPAAIKKNTKKYRLKFPYGFFRVGHMIVLNVDKQGLPLKSFWRKRLKLNDIEEIKNKEV